MTEIPDRARPHHWGFANAWLRNSFKRKPETIVLAIARAPGPEPVVEAWRNFAKTLDEEERVPPQGLETASYQIGDSREPWYVAVVDMPEVEGREEAELVALAVRPGDGELRPEREGETPREETETRYVVLERAADGETRWIEWVGDDRETRDLQPAADREHFVRALRDERTKDIS